MPIDNKNALCFGSGQKVYFLNFLVHLSVSLKIDFDKSATIRSGMVELVRDTMTLANVQRVLFWSVIDNRMCSVNLHLFYIQSKVYLNNATVLLRGSLEYSVAFHLSIPSNP